MRQCGQGMTEYIIIVALIAIAAIAVYSFFGDTIRGQMGAMTQELAGQQGNLKDVQKTAKDAAKEGKTHRDLGNYTGER